MHKSRKCRSFVCPEQGSIVASHLSCLSRPTDKSFLNLAKRHPSLSRNPPYLDQALPGMLANGRCLSSGDCRLFPDRVVLIVKAGTLGQLAPRRGESPRVVRATRGHLFTVKANTQAENVNIEWRPISFWLWAFYPRLVHNQIQPHPSNWDRLVKQLSEGVVGLRVSVSVF